MYTQTEKVNIRPKSYLPVFRVSEGDVGRTLTAHLVSDEGDISIPIGATVTMAGTKPSGLGYTVTGTVDGSDVSFDTDAVMTDEPGRIVSEIRIVQGDTVIGTTNVVLSIEPNPHPNDTTDGQRGPLINELTAILEDITEQIDRFTGLSAEAETLQPGSEATASYQDGVLTIGVPKGEQGEQGPQGPQGKTGPKGDKGDTGEVSLETLAKVMVSDTASGTIATFSDGSDVLPAKSVLVTLTPIQDLHGYDKPWVGGAGKNKLKNGFSGSVTNNGVTATGNNDGTLSLSGTATASTAPITNLAIGATTTEAQFDSKKHLPNGTYKVLPTGDSGVHYQVMATNTNVSSAVLIFNSASGTFTIDDTYSYNWVRVYVAKGTNVNGLKVHPMVMLSTETDETYEPYSNICPISGWDSVETVVSPTQSADDGTTYQTTLPQTVYGGTLDVVSGVLTVDRAMITIDGTNYNMAMSGGSKRCYISDLSVPKAKPSPNTHTPAPNLIANYLTAVGDAEAYSGAVGVCIYAAESANIGFTLTGEVMTFAEVKSYLASNPLQVCYELAEPQTYQLTPTEVNTLIGDNNVWGGDAVVVDYYADTKLYIEKVLGA